MSRDRFRVRLGPQLCSVKRILEKSCIGCSKWASQVCHYLKKVTLVMILAVPLWMIAMISVIINVNLKKMTSEMNDSENGEL